MSGIEIKCHSGALGSFTSSSEIGGDWWLTALNSVVVVAIDRVGNCLSMHLCITCISCDLECLYKIQQCLSYDAMNGSAYVP